MSQSALYPARANGSGLSNHPAASLPTSVPAITKDWSANFAALATDRQKNEGLPAAFARLSVLPRRRRRGIKPMVIGAQKSGCTFENIIGVRRNNSWEGF